MSDDPSSFDIAHQLHHDLVVERPTVADKTEVTADLEKAAHLGRMPKIAHNRLFLHPRWALSSVGTVIAFLLY
jgi:hypothetical protein